MIYICIPSALKIIQCEDETKALEELREYGWDLMESDLKTCIESKEVIAPMIVAEDIQTLVNKMYVNCVNFVEFTREVTKSFNLQDSKYYKGFEELLSK